MAVSPVTLPLLAVALVFRSKPEFDGITDVASTVSAYVDSSVEQPLHKACKFGSVVLLNRIWDSTVDLESSGWGLWLVRNLLCSQKLYRRYQFSICPLEAAKTNSVEITRWPFDRFPYDVRKKVVSEAMKAGVLDILQFFWAHARAIHTQEDEEAGYEELDEERENWEGERYIHIEGFDATEAALARHVDLVKWVYKELGDMRRHCSSISAAFSVGDIKLVDWIMGQVDMDPEGYEALHGAAANGYVETLQWFQDNGKYMKWSTGTLIKAAEAGQFELVQWIIDRDRKDDTLGYESGPDEYNPFDDVCISRRTYVICLGGEAHMAIHAAAINGHLEVAKYLHGIIEKPCNQDEEDVEKHRLSQRKGELW